MRGIYGVPRVPRLSVSRPRLHEALDGDAALTIVHGASGVGKTVAVAEWASRPTSAARGVWLTVDEDCTTRLAFWGALAEVLSDAKIAPTGVALSEGLKSLDSGVDPRRLILRAFAMLPGDVTIVIDDFWRISSDFIRQDVLALVQAIPRLTMVIIARGVSEWGAAGNQLSLAPAVIGPNELHLTAAEVSDALTLMHVVDPGGTIAETLMQTVSGHPLLTKGIIQALSRDGRAVASASLRADVTELGAQLLRELFLSGMTSSEQARATMFCAVPAALTAELFTDIEGAVTSATVTVSYQPAAVDDVSTGNPAGSPVRVDVTGNDHDDVDPTTVRLIDPNTGNPVLTLVVPGEGTWTVDPSTGVVTFTPEAGFEGDPTPVGYTATDINGFDVTALITISYVPASLVLTGANSIPMLLMGLLLLLAGAGALRTARRRA